MSGGVRPGRRPAPVPDPDSPLGRFAVALRALRRDAGSPSFEALARETSRLDYPFSDTSLRNAVTGRIRPSREVTELFVRACVAYAHAHPERAADRAREWDVRALVAVWTRRWSELAGAGAGAGAGDGAPDRPESAGPAGNLPAELTTFVGREDELDSAGALLAAARLVTLTGTGGVGKTRLALRLAHRVRSRHPDGVWVVELAGVQDASTLGRHVASALGVPAEAGRDPLRAIADALAARRLLLVLDNCEHLLDATAALVRGLLAACAPLTVLATSRQALDVAGEHVLPVLPLATTGEAVTLFTDRARAAAPGFAVTSATDDGQVAEVCRRLDGLPLALEIAARRLRTRTLGQLLEDLDHSPLLDGRGGERGAPPRHQTLRALLEWSFGLCTPHERQVWLRLSVCAGAVSAEAAEALCADTGMSPAEVAEAVAGLVDASLLHRVGRDPRTRLGMLETVRAFGREHLAASGEEQAVRRLHTAWYLSLGAGAPADYHSSRQVDCFRRLRSEHQDICLALDTALRAAPEGNPPDAEVLEGAAGLWLYWLACGVLHEGAYWMRRFMERYPEPPTPGAAPRWCRLAWSTAFVLQVNGDADGAGRWLARCREGIRALPDDDAARFAGPLLQLQGLHALFAGEMEKCRELTGATLDALRVHGNGIVEQQALGQAAMAASVQGERATARRLFKETLAMGEAVGECWHRSYVLWVWAVDVMEDGRLDAAVDLLAESLRLKRLYGDRIGVAAVSEGLAWVQVRRGDAVGAARLLGATCTSWEFSERRLFGFGHLEENSDRCAAEVRAALAPEVFEEQYAAGAALGLTAVLAGILGDDPGTGDPVTRLRHRDLDTA